MSCRWKREGDSARRGEPSRLTDASAAAVYTDLARAGRREDFIWFARSQGLPEADVEGLWLHFLRAGRVNPILEEAVAPLE